MVPMAALPVQRDRRGTAWAYAILAACAWPIGHRLQRTPAAFCCRSDRALGTRLRAAGDGFRSLGMDLSWPVLLPAQPAATLLRLLLRRLCHRRLRHRSQRAS